MKKGLLKRLNINRESVKRVLRQALSPTFLVCLTGAFLLWFSTELSLEYTTAMPLNLRIDGQRFRVTAIVSGRGSTIVAQRLSLKNKLSLSLDELSKKSSTEREGALVITPASLKKAINAKISKLTVDELIYVPEFVPQPKSEPEPAAE